MINKDPIFDKMKNFLKIFQVPHVNDLSPTKKIKVFLKSCFSTQYYLLIFDRILCTDALYIKGKNSRFV